MGKYCCIFSTVPDIKKARKIAGLLLFKRLAACVSILPGLESHYRWKGKKEKSKEVLMFIKTKSNAFAAIEKIFHKHHPYQVPELILLPIKKGNARYLKWISEEVKTV